MWLTHRGPACRLPDGAAGSITLALALSLFIAHCLVSRYTQIRASVGSLAEYSVSTATNMSECLCIIFWAWRVRRRDVHYSNREAYRVSCVRTPELSGLSPRFLALAWFYQEDRIRATQLQTHCNIAVDEILFFTVKSGYYTVST